MKDKIGLLFSHLHVRENELYKFNMLKYSIEHFKSFDSDFYIVVSGHGINPPDFITEQIDNMYWESEIDTNEIGVGHPKFCIKGYELLLHQGISKCMKLRGSDLITKEDKLLSALKTSKVTLTEQTSFDRGMIGDLLMIGTTTMVHDLWTKNSWNYKKSGLYNLFDNARSLCENHFDLHEQLKNKYNFLSPHEIGWMTLENNWNDQELNIIEPFSQKHLWGHMQGYGYYGGF